MDYWNKKEVRKQQAQAHTAKMYEICPDEIKHSIQNTVIYSPGMPSYHSAENKPEVILEKADSVSAAFRHQGGKTAILNFASYKNPGGMFFQGSSAQEESLCHESYLYNVLRAFDDTYYSWNRSHLNRAMYCDRALYTPDVRFYHNQELAVFDVITCAAPNIGAGQKYQHVTNEENTRTLRQRMIFIKNIAEEQNVDTLILGAYGCGVFRQNASEVAQIWKDIFVTSGVKTIVHPIPDDKNFFAFQNVFSKN